MRRPSEQAHSCRRRAAATSDGHKPWGPTLETRTTAFERRRNSQLNPHHFPFDPSFPPGYKRGSLSPCDLGDRSSPFCREGSPVRSRSYPIISIVDRMISIPRERPRSGPLAPQRSSSIRTTSLQLARPPRHKAHVQAFRSEFRACDVGIAGVLQLTGWCRTAGEARSGERALH